MTKVYNCFEKIIIACVAILVVILTVDSFGRIGQIASRIEYNKYSMEYLIAVFFGIVLFFLLCFAFRIIEKISNRGQIFIMLAVVAIVLAVRVLLVMKYDIRPSTDSFDDIEVAYYLTQNPTVTMDNYHVGTISIFGNNYTFIILLKDLLLALKSFSSETTLRILYIINAVIISLSDILLWLSIKNVFSKKTANKALLLIALNPVMYILVFWAYTCTVSVFFTMMILYCAIKFYQTDSMLKQVLLSVVTGVMIILGYKIRPTAIFIFFAIIIVGTGAVLKNRKLFKRVAITAIIIIAVMAIGLGVSRKMDEKYFGQVKGENFPITFWLAMGSHGTGSLATTGEDLALANNEDLTAEEKNKALLESVIHNYKEQGVSGILNLWYRKMCTTWSDSYAAAYARMAVGTWQGDIYELLAGNKKELVELFCQIYRCLIWLFIAIYAIRLLKVQPRKMDAILMITLFGAIVFYWFWEAKGIYSVPFYSIMCVLAVRGIEASDSSIEVMRRKCACFKFSAIWIILIIFVCINLNCLLRLGTDFSFYKIRTSLSGRVHTVINKDPTTDEMPTKIQQDFYINGSMNRITLLDVGKTYDPDNTSTYHYQILDDNQGILAEGVIDSSMSEKGYIILDIPEIIGQNHLTLVLEKDDPEKDSILFVTQKSYFVDLYPGTMLVDGQQIYNSDLMMDIVEYKNEELLLNPKRMLLLTGIMLISVISWCGFTAGAWKCHKKENKSAIVRRTK